MRQGLCLGHTRREVGPTYVASLLDPAFGAPLGTLYIMWSQPPGALQVQISSIS